MNEHDPRKQSAAPDDGEHGRLVSAYVAGDREAGERLTALLTDTARITVRHFLNRETLDGDDLVQDAVLSVLDYLRRRGGFTGDLVGFTISVTRNRCRNWLIWKSRHPSAEAETALRTLRDPGSGPLEALAEQEILDLMQKALYRLDTGCRRLLRALYLEGVPVEEMRRRSGLSSVQAIYYRRARCLKSLGRLLKIRLRDCSSTEGAEGE